MCALYKMQHAIMECLEEQQQGFVFCFCLTLCLFQINSFQFRNAKLLNKENGEHWFFTSHQHKFRESWCFY